MVAAAVVEALEEGCLERLEGGVAGGSQRRGGDAVDVGVAGVVLIAPLLEQPPADEDAEQVLAVAAAAQALDLAAGGAAEMGAERDRLELLTGEVGDLLELGDLAGRRGGAGEGADADVGAILDGVQTDGGEAPAEAQDALADGGDADAERRGEGTQGGATLEEDAGGEAGEMLLEQPGRGRGRDERVGGGGEAEAGAQAGEGGDGGDARPRSMSEMRLAETPVARARARTPRCMAVRRRRSSAAMAAATSG
jgi:hypothetical protein